MESDDGLFSACVLDGKGGGARIGWAEVEAWTEDQGVLWVDLDYTHERARQWLQERSGMHDVVAEAVLAETTRPRCVAIGDGLLLLLRGVNLNPGAEPDDMVSIRLWIEPHRIISTRMRRLFSVKDILQALESGTGPQTAGQFLVELSERLAVRMAEVIENMDDVAERLEDELDNADPGRLRSDLRSIRQQTIGLRRYLTPQREAMIRLQAAKMSWLSDEDLLQLYEIADRMTRYVEALDATRERASVIHEELLSQSSQQMEKRMYLLSLIAAVFLPLGLFTGLLGINVGGIPGADSHWGFLAVCGLLVLVAILEVWIFKRRRWM